MKNIILLAAVFVLTISSVQGQKKKDLLAEIDQLRQELKVTKGELNDSRQKEKSTLAQVQSMETQVKDLKETNASLLTNMSNFTQLSNQKAKNIQKSQEIIQAKDKQLNTINESISKSDSVKLAVLTVFKNSLGSEGSIVFKNGEIYITVANTLLFGEDDKNTKVEDKAKGILGRIAKTLNDNPDIKITVEGNSNALKFDGKTMIDNWDLSTRQAAAIVRTLQTEFEVDPKRMNALGKSEYGSQSIETATRIIIDPKFDDFYVQIKETMKNASKD
ncbi:OmpA family protein [Aquimarina sp. 2201CG5-10]|uniref:OmpA family protein n=1 Tax=Aquimarina callyspongiae TaxID=3098150 RepID=UPI002AB5D27F|nr:OmpA family protein [Aquimarina sp. 2201CG5-10]MDY8137447.1 OmpA family protein [Aquimarina sp. 2201CG5-10]